MGACCGMDKRLTMYEVNAGETGGAAEQATDDNPVLESKNKTADGAWANLTSTRRASTPLSKMATRANKRAKKMKNPYRLERCKRRSMP